VIEIKHGLLEGKKTETKEVIKNGKNLDRSNATTSDEQAFLEAKSKWKKKKDSGYELKVSSSDVNLKPMLANDYKKFKDTIKFPVYTQPKLDGYRLLYDGFSDKILSRTGKEYHILYDTELHKSLKKFNNIILDGELYCEDPDFLFESYGVLRKKKISKNDQKILEKISYHVYDAMMPGSFSERMSVLEKIIKNVKKIKLVETLKCKDTSCLEKYNSYAVSIGYEGSMVRNPDSVYSHFRTKDLLKYKTFDDAEFKVVGFEKEIDTKGDGAEPVVWVAQTKDGKKFKVPSKGTREERTLLFKNGKNYIGKFLTVKFFGYSNEGIPRFPKTLRPGVSSFRKDL
jgi:DNA ligase-1